MSIHIGDFDQPLDGTQPFHGIDGLHRLGDAHILEQHANIGTDNCRQSRLASQQAISRCDASPLFTVNAPA
ncbi:hypothetical protein DWV00_03160 [Trinickia dinghuensis]|uniref:Uncharacterized protein n=1 Tax=Trinickia dinghuensis TaxID=2291023 RepID=A0A3D8K5P9_9BURK|nr:hypothetical protein DWV00_03160 [Trinickia dinghuensis]